MATIQTNEDFVSACNHLIASNQLTVQGARYIDRVARKVIDERIGGNVDITPIMATLESALDAATVTMTTEQTKAVARTLMLSNAKNFLSNQLAAPQWNAATLTEVYTTVKVYVDSNPLLGQMVANQITLCSNSLTWVLNLITPTAVDRQRYLFCVQLVLATIA